VLDLFFLLIIFVMVGVAFLTLLERKVIFTFVRVLIRLNLLVFFSRLEYNSKIANGQTKVSGAT
jgi:hypothetical protein